eukprot:Lithocolla_globosa_v1_NODE_1134_length_2844_cov_458.295805.p1 type:complete len:618 gc:universal NODE_1134_length_2844_cov_458.295805:2305-452(-)
MTVLRPNFKSSKIPKISKTPKAPKRLHTEDEFLPPSPSPSPSPPKKKVASTPVVLMTTVSIPIAEGVQHLTDTLYDLQKKEMNIPFQWEPFLEAIGPRNKSFATEFLESMRANEKGLQTQLALQRRAMSSLLVLVNGNNKFVRYFQKENALHNGPKMSTDALDMQHRMGTASSHQTLGNDQRVIATAHDKSVRLTIKKFEDRFLNGGLDDFTAITEKRQAELVLVNGAWVMKTHNVLNMATATFRPLDCPAVPAFVPPFHYNVAALDSSKVCAFILLNAVKLSRSYNENKLRAPVVGAPFPLPPNADDDVLFTLVCHHYDASVFSVDQLRRLSGSWLVDEFGPHPLKSRENYMTALDIIGGKGLASYLEKNLFVMICDYPGQYHIRKAAMLSFLGRENWNPFVCNILSILGGLHVSLNSREMIGLRFQELVWLPFYRWIFGNRKILAKKPKPWRIALILSLADGGWRTVRVAVKAAFGDCQDPEYLLYFNLLDTLVPLSLDIYAVIFKRGNALEPYLEAVLQLCLTLWFPMRRKNYNKIGPAFVSDMLLWRSYPVGHPLRDVYDVIESNLNQFDDWWPEGFHSLIRRRVTPDSPAARVTEAGRWRGCTQPCAELDAP